MMQLYWSPRSRSFSALWLMEETGQPYERVLTDITTGAQKRVEYLAINPMGKVPAIVHDGALVTEQGAVYAYLADLYPEAGITPAIGDPLRGPYLRWLFYYGSSFEPALIDKSLKREPAPASTSPYGDYETMLKTLTDQLAAGPFLLGDRFTAADVLWGTALRWTTMFKLVPESPVVTGYIARVTSRPAVARAAKIDADLIAMQNAG
jgi:glutathione S-transferase